MRRTGWLVFLALFGALVAVSHFDIGVHLIVGPGLEPPWSTAGWSLLAFLGLALWLRPVLHGALPLAVERVHARIASTWMGFGFLALLACLASDLMLGLVDGVLAVTAGVRGPVVSPAAQAALIALATLGFGLAGMRSALGRPAVRRLDLELDRWPHALDGFRIVQLSDVHVGPILGRRFVEWLVARTNGLGPDLVVITGDLVDGSVEELEPEVAPLAGLEARHGAFFVTGNHDYFSKADPWVAEVERLGIRALRNAHVTIGEGSASFDLAGVDDHFARHLGPGEGEDVAKALAGRDPSRPVVLLAHNPATFRRAAEHGVDLQLSGHTHGGQIWPFRWAVRLFTAYVAGEYRRQGSRLYVSRGTGFWGPPMRLLAPAEITEIVLRSPARGSRIDGVGISRIGMDRPPHEEEKLD